MTGKSNRPESEITQRIEAVRASRATSFRGLLEDGGFDLSRDLRFQNLSGLSFAGENLRGIDFTGANLVGTDFTDALIEGARFDRARLGMMTPELTMGSTLEDARDWVAYASGWRPDNNAPETDDHLPVGALFVDAPYLPHLVVLPSFKTPSRSYRIAISLGGIDTAEFDFWYQTELKQKDRELLIRNLTGPGRDIYTMTGWNDVVRYARWASHETQKAYRPISENEWEFACKGAFEPSKDRLGVPVHKANWYVNCHHGMWEYCFTEEKGQQKKTLRTITGHEDEKLQSFRVCRELVIGAHKRS